MADQKISALTEVTAPASSDVVPIVNAGATKKTQIANLVKLGNVAIWARVFHSTSQSINSSSATAIAFNSERADTDTIHDNVTNNSRLTCKTAGVYHVSANVEWAANTAGTRELFLQVNGATRVADVIAHPVQGGNVTRQMISAVYSLAVNDYVELIANQTSGGALNINNNANFSPELMMIRLGA